MHYDASRELRANGAGYYQFTADAERMAVLLGSRKETALKTRQDPGAEDLTPGQEEGMTADDVEIRVPGKRKRRTEGRQQMVGAKRQKLQRLREAYESRQSHSTSNTNALAELETLTAASAPWTVEPFAALETLSHSNTDTHLWYPDAPAYHYSGHSSWISSHSQSPGKYLAASTDPFSVLETQASIAANSKASASPPDPFSALDTRKPASTVVRYKGKKPVPPTANKTD